MNHKLFWLPTFFLINLLRLIWSFWFSILMQGKHVIRTISYLKNKIEKMFKMWCAAPSSLLQYGRRDPGVWSAVQYQ